eukprot:Sspe_Gene.90092::Locus_61717_Transcript_1_3_Confidence_0.250_Length_1560::g.90092::m.90092
MGRRQLINPEQLQVLLMGVEESAMHAVRVIARQEKAAFARLLRDKEQKEHELAAGILISHLFRPEKPGLRCGRLQRTEKKRKAHPQGLGRTRTSGGRERRGKEQSRERGRRGDEVVRAPEPGKEAEGGVVAEGDQGAEVGASAGFETDQPDRVTCASLRVVCNAAQGVGETTPSLALFLRASDPSPPATPTALPSNPLPPSTKSFCPTPAFELVLQAVRDDIPRRDGIPHSLEVIKSAAESHELLSAHGVDEKEDSLPPPTPLNEYAEQLANHRHRLATARALHKAQERERVKQQLAAQAHVAGARGYQTWASSRRADRPTSASRPREALRRHKRIPPPPPSPPRPQRHHPLHFNFRPLSTAQQAALHALQGMGDRDEWAAGGGVDVVRKATKKPQKREKWERSGRRAVLRGAHLGRGVGKQPVRADTQWPTADGVVPERDNSATANDDLPFQYLKSVTASTGSVDSMNHDLLAAVLERLGRRRR